MRRRLRHTARSLPQLAASLSRSIFIQLARRPRARDGNNNRRNRQDHAQEEYYPAPVTAVPHSNSRFIPSDRAAL